MVKQPLSLAAADIIADDLAHPVDVHVGTRIRLRRKMLGFSQSEMAQLLGISFQQVQKYEKGTNRISCSRLYELAFILQTHIDFFLQDIPANVNNLFVELIASRAPRLTENNNIGWLGASKQGNGQTAAANDDGGAGNGASVSVNDPLYKKEILELVLAFNKITDDQQRQLFLELAKGFVKSK
ncbi:MAG: helix-turn-helix transcriptional regulator [Alphaproteobacteria bacterium]|nr:helix-turn-helix transcriptional regulator [Alphaproteobacteria bacterium]